MLKNKIKKSILKRIFLKTKKKIKVLNSNRNHLFTNKSKFSKKKSKSTKFLNNFKILNKFI